MKSYAVLNNLKPTAFLNWEQFATNFDTDSNLAYRAEQYRKGKLIGLKSRSVSISCNSTWGARGKDGSSTCSYEGIGYHAGTCSLLRGFIDSGVPIVVYRSTESGITETWIQ